MLAGHDLQPDSMCAAHTAVLHRDGIGSFKSHADIHILLQPTTLATEQHFAQ